MFHKNALGLRRVIYKNKGFTDGCFNCEQILTHVCSIVCVSLCLKALWNLLYLLNTSPHVITELTLPIFMSFPPL